MDINQGMIRSFRASFLVVDLNTRLMSAKPFSHILSKASLFSNHFTGSTWDFFSYAKNFAEVVLKIGLLL